MSSVARLAEPFLRRLEQTHMLLLEHQLVSGTRDANEHLTEPLLIGFGVLIGFALLDRLIRSEVLEQDPLWFKGGLVVVLASNDERRSSNLLHSLPIPAPQRILGARHTR